MSELEAKRETIVLSPVEKQTKFDCVRKLKNIVSEEEIKFKQIAREKHIREGYENTKYFHLKAKGKQRRIRIHSLISDDQTIQGGNKINTVATTFYKELFGH